MYLFWSSEYDLTNKEEIGDEHYLEEHMENEEHGDKEIAWRIQETADKENSNDEHSQDDSTTESKISALEDSSLRSDTLETTAGSLEHSMGDKNEEKPYTPLDIRLVPDEPQGEFRSTDRREGLNTPLTSDTSQFYLSAD